MTTITLVGGHCLLLLYVTRKRIVVVGVPVIGEADGEESVIVDDPLQLDAAAVRTSPALGQTAGTARPAVRNTTIPTTITRADTPLACTIE